MSAWQRRPGHLALVAAVLLSSSIIAQGAPAGVGRGEAGQVMLAGDNNKATVRRLVLARTTPTAGLEPTQALNEPLAPIGMPPEHTAAAAPPPLRPEQISLKATGETSLGAAMAAPGHPRRLLAANIDPHVAAIVDSRNVDKPPQPHHKPDMASSPRRSEYLPAAAGAATAGAAASSSSSSSSSSRRAAAVPNPPLAGAAAANSHEQDRHREQERRSARGSVATGNGHGLDRQPPAAAAAAAGIGMQPAGAGGVHAAPQRDRRQVPGHDAEEDTNAQTGNDPSTPATTEDPLAALSLTSSETTVPTTPAVTTTTEPLEEPDRPLAERINADDAEEKMAEFSDRRVNFRSKRVISAFEEKRDDVIRKLHQHLFDISTDPSLSAEERDARTEAFDMIERKVNSTHIGYVAAVNELQSVLDRDYSSYSAIVEFSEDDQTARRKRVEKLQLAAVREEAMLKRMQELERIAARFEEQRRAANTSTHTSSNRVNQALDEVSGHAEDLQKILDDHAFLNAQRVRNAELITVVKVLLGEETQSESKAKAGDSEEEKGEGVMSMLIDGANNQYALIKPKAASLVPEDSAFMNDIVVLLVLCFAAGLVCRTLGLPPLVGYVGAGTIIGPAGFNVIMSVVQIGTLGEFGVLILLFTLGMEFSLGRLRELWRVGVLGGTAMTLGVIVAGTAVGVGMTLTFSESLFVAICVSLSSTTLAANQMTSHDQETPHGRGLLAILLMQDVLLGGIIALLPLFSALGDISVLEIIVLLLQLVVSFVFLAIIAFGLTKLVLGRLFHFVQSAEPSLKVLSAIFPCFLMLKITEHLGVSMELGCFVAGLMVNVTLNFGKSTAAEGQASGHHHSSGVHSVVELIDPVRELFLAIFFASMGMHVYPTFLIENRWILFLLTIGTVVLKYTVSMLVWVVGLRNTNFVTGHIIAVGLAQVSEFSFVLASRGKRMGVISRPMYYLLLSVTALTLLQAPLLWKLAFPVSSVAPRTTATK